MPSTNTSAYYALIESLIADQQEVWGNPALEIANGVSGLVVSETVTESGDIWVNGNEREVAGRLADSYIDRFGQSAAASLRDVASDYEDDVDLPAVLQTEDGS